MSDIEAIKGRVRKLMALANEGSASDGEIENAMRMAAALVDKHHLDMDELSRSEQDIADQKMGRSTGKTGSSKWHRWETTLAHAVVELFGCIKHYLSHDQVPLRVNGVVQMYSGKYAGQMKMCRQIVFYGPALEAQEASELYTEWATLIATMGVIRWGGAFRGDGELYCQGFADKLYEIARQTNAARRQLTAPAPKLLAAEQAEGSKALALVAGQNQITLRARFDVLKLRADSFLKNECKIKLGGRITVNGSGSSNGEAYRDGQSAAAAAGFGRNKPRKALPGS